MAKKGLAIPIIAEYENKGNGVVAYSNPMTADHAVEYSAEIETQESNDLTADNRVQESAPKIFTKGTLNLTTADLPADLAIKILGLKMAERQIGGKAVQEVIYDDDANPPYLGFGIIEEHQIDNVTMYKPIVLAKVKFSTPGLAATTRDKEIDWQTQEISADIYRSDRVDENYKHPWQFSPKTWMTTEEEAKAYIMAVLSENSTTVV